MNGFAGPIKPLITPHLAPKIVILTIADTIFITNMQKRENRMSILPLDNMKKQVA